MGILVSIKRWKQPAYAFLLISLAAGMLPAALAVGGPNNLRSSGSLPSTYLMVGIGAASIIEIAKRGTKRLASQSIHLALAVLLTLSFVNETIDFFFNWPRNSDTRYFFRTALTQASLDLPQGGRSCISTPYPHDLSQWVAGYATGKDPSGICWFFGRNAFVIPYETDNVYWFIPEAISPDDYLAHQENAELASIFESLLAPYTTQQTGAFPDGSVAYRVYSAVDIANLRTQIFADQASQITPEKTYGWDHTTKNQKIIDLDGGLSLIKSQYRWNAISRILEVLVYWEVNSPRVAQEPLSIFVQLLDNSNEYVTGDDHLDYATNSWRQKDIFIQHHRLQIPETLLPGIYHLQTGVYNTKTGNRWHHIQPGGTPDDRIQLQDLTFP